MLTLHNAGSQFRIFGKLPDWNRVYTHICPDPEGSCLRRCEFDARLVKACMTVIGRRYLDIFINTPEIPVSKFDNLFHSNVVWLRFVSAILATLLWRLLITICTDAFPCFIISCLRFTSTSMKCEICMLSHKCFCRCLIWYIKRGCHHLCRFVIRDPTNHESHLSNSESQTTCHLIVVHKQPDLFRTVVTFLLVGQKLGDRDCLCFDRSSSTLGRDWRTTARGWQSTMCHRWVIWQDLQDLCQCRSLGAFGLRCDSCTVIQTSQCRQFLWMMPGSCTGRRVTIHCLWVWCIQHLSYVMPYWVTVILCD